MTQLTSSTLDTIRETLRYERIARLKQFEDSGDPYYTERIAEIDATLDELNRAQKGAPQQPIGSGEATEK